MADSRTPIARFTPGLLLPALCSCMLSYNQSMDGPEIQVQQAGNLNAPAVPMEPAEKRRPGFWTWVSNIFTIIWLLLSIGCLYQRGYVSPGAVLVHSGNDSNYFGYMNVKLEGDVLATFEKAAPGQLELCISSPPGENESRTSLPYYNPASQMFLGLVIALDRILLVDTAGNLHCHDLQGKELWQLPNSNLGGELPWETPSVVNHGQLLVHQPGWLLAMDCDANVLWKHRRSGYSGTSLTAPDCPYIYFQNEDGIAILSADGTELAHCETQIPYLSQYTFTADGALLFTSGPDYYLEQTVNMLLPDGSVKKLYEIPDVDFSDAPHRRINTIQMIGTDQILLGSDAGLYICDLQGSARRLTQEPCNIARYCPLNDVIAWEPAPDPLISLFTISKPDHIYLSKLDGVIAKEYKKKTWGCTRFTEDSSGRIYTLDYHGNVRRLDL